MRTITIALIALLACSSCGLLGNSSDDTPVDWPALVECVANDETVLKLIGLIGDAFFAGETEETLDTLEDIARDYAPEAVLCASETVLRQWESPGAAADPQRKQATARGRAAMKRIGARVILPPEPGPDVP